MVSGMIFVSITSFFLFLGISYIVLMLANREDGWRRVAGLVIAVSIAVLALVTLVSGMIYRDSMNGRWGSAGMMTDGNYRLGIGGDLREQMNEFMDRMMGDKELLQEFMDRAMEKPDIRKFMNKCLAR